jgi:hypothetical protein
MSNLKAIILVICLIAGVGSQQYAGHVDKQIACGAAADSSRNHNEAWLANLGSYAAVIVGGLTAFSSRFPALGGIVTAFNKSNANLLGDLAKLVIDKGSPDALKLLGLINQELNGKLPPTPTPQQGEPPSRDECVAQLIRRIELDSAKRVAS